MSWWDRAVCKEAPPDIFYPKSKRAVPRETIQWCQICPVRTECLEHALEAGEDQGIWGGMTPLQRSRL
jgi:WhiB family redox-sensing transcriptional regulator